MVDPRCSFGAKRWLASTVLATGMACAPAANPAALDVEPDADSSGSVVSPSTPERDRGLVGVVVVGEPIDVAANTAGRLLEVRPQVGDTVELGEVVATVDDRQLDTELAAVRAQLVSQRAALLEAELRVKEAAAELVRSEALARAGAASSVTAEQSEFAAQRQRAQAKQARAAVEKTRREVEHLELRRAEAIVRAPIAGVVAERYLGRGAVVAESTPILRLLGGRSVRIRFAVEPADLTSLVPGDAVDVDVRGLPGPLSATVRSRSPEVDAASGLIFLDADLDEQPPRLGLHRGTSVTVRPRP